MTFLGPITGKSLSSQVVYLNSSRNLCHGCHYILCKENEKTNLAADDKRQVQAFPRSLSSLLFTQNLNLPSRSYPSHEDEVCPRPGFATSCSFRQGNHPAQGSLTGWQHHFPEPSSQNNTAMREETITA